MCIYVVIFCIYIAFCLCAAFYYRNDVIHNLKLVYKLLCHKYYIYCIAKEIQLVQALLDKNKQLVSSLMKDKNLLMWINNAVPVSKLNCTGYDFEFDVCLCRAAHLSTVDVLLHLVTTGANVHVRDGRGDSVLHSACASHFDRVEKVKFLINTHRSLMHTRNVHNSTPLHCAVIEGHCDVISVLVGHGADVNARGFNGESALHTVCKRNRVDCIHELLQHGADVEARDEEQDTPLLHAAMYNRSECMTALLETYGAQANVKNKHNQMPLHFVAQNNNAEFIHILIDRYGDDVNVIDKSGDTPLCLAIEYGHLDAVQALMSYPDCDVRSRSARGNALETALLYKHENVVQYLQNSHPKINVEIKIVRVNETLKLIQDELVTKIQNIPEQQIRRFEDFCKRMDILQNKTENLENMESSEVDVLQQEVEIYQTEVKDFFMNIL